MSLLTRTNGGLRTKSLFPRTLLTEDFFNLPWVDPDFFSGDGFRGQWMPAANLKENDKSFTVELAVPGYDRKDIKVVLEDNNVLTISAERKEERKEEKENFTRREFSYGSFSRSFELPESVNENKIAATCNAGILTVELPKSEVSLSKKKMREIKVS